MKMAKETFLKRTSQLSEMSSDRNMALRLVWIVLAPFYEMRYENDGVYFPEDAMAEGENWRKEQKNNLEFYQTVSPFRATSFRSCKLLAVRLLPKR